MLTFACQNIDCTEFDKEVRIANLNQPIDLKCPHCNSARLKFNQNITLLCGHCKEDKIEVKAGDRIDTKKKPHTINGMEVYCVSRNTGHLTTWDIRLKRKDSDYIDGIYKDYVETQNEELTLKTR